MGMNPRLKTLYKEVILKHNAQPFHFEKKETADLKIEGNNPLCGDRFQFFLELVEGKITTAHFHGFGCAISKASASILTQKIEGKTLAAAREICADFLQFIEGENREQLMDENQEAFLAVDEFPARKECAVLGWKAINDYLSEEDFRL